MGEAAAENNTIYVCACIYEPSKGTEKTCYQIVVDRALRREGGKVRGGEILTFLPSAHLYYFEYIKKCLFLFERVTTSRGGIQREGDQESDAGSALRAETQMWGLNS